VKCHSPTDLAPRKGKKIVSRFMNNPNHELDAVIHVFLQLYFLKNFYSAEGVFKHEKKKFAGNVRSERGT